jgi:hypothetical protein
MFFLKSVVISYSIRNNTMSYSATSTASKTKTNTLCVVCRDAGKTEKEYTSHFVKDQPGPNGKVICPTLLNQACRICGKTGHTSSYCSQYHPRRQERYIEREREPRRDDDRRDISYNRLHEDTERHEREIRERDEQYQREQDRRSKPWLQAAIKPASQQQQHQRRVPYAHPHGPRVRLQLEAPALAVSTSAPTPLIDLPSWGTPEYWRLFQTDDSNSSSIPAASAIDIRKVELHHAANWGDEDASEQFVCDPTQMTRQFFEKEIMSTLTTDEEHDFIARCDDQSQMPFECGH